jgi:hypothetical protein
VSEPQAPPRAAVTLSAATRALMLALGFLPLLHLVAVAAAAAWAPGGPAGRLAAALVVLYLLPPLAARAGAWLMPLPSGEVGTDEHGFLAWWLSAQWQVVFSRVRLLEEALRLVPGLYSAWLRLWGSRVGSLVYWSPGVELLDRGLVEIGDRVVFGAGVRLAGHVLLPGAEGRARLLVGPVKIGREALVGAYSVLVPGAEVLEGSSSPPLRLLRPSSRRPGREGEPR